LASATLGHASVVGQQRATGKGVLSDPKAGQGQAMGNAHYALQISDQI
jgi:hypothetical protein